MADISVRGYVNKPTVREGSKGQFSTFTLNERVNQNGEKKSVFYNVTNFESSEPPPDGSWATVKGWLKVRTYEKDGQQRQSLDINCKELEFNPPKPKDGEAPAGAAKEPWDE